MSVSTEEVKETIEQSAMHPRMTPLFAASFQSKFKSLNFHTIALADIVDQSLKLHILTILNQSLVPLMQNADCIEFLQTYPWLTVSEKERYLSKALFEVEADFIHSLYVFLNTSVGELKPVISEKFSFACFLKLINDLCSNHLMLLNVKGTMMNAWVHYFPNQSVSTRNIRSVIQYCLKEAGFSLSLITAPNSFERYLALDYASGINPESFLKGISQAAHENLSVDEQHFICNLFKLRHFKIDDLGDFLECSQKKNLLFDKEIPLSDLYFLYGLAPELVIFLVNHFQECMQFIKAGVSSSSLCTLAQLDIMTYRYCLQNASLLVPLIKEHWLPMDEVIDFIRMNERVGARFCNDYFEHPENLVRLKNAGVPFSMLIRAKVTPVADIPDILVSVEMEESFEYLCKHSKVNLQVFCTQLEGVTSIEKYFFKFACTKSPIFRYIIQKSHHVHALLGMGFEFSALVLHAGNNFSEVKGLIDYTESVRLLLGHPDITPDILLKSNLEVIALKHVNAIIYLLSHQFSLSELTNCPNIPLSILFKYPARLNELKKSKLDLPFWHLCELYPKHALLILKDPSDCYAKWWFDEQRGKISQLSLSKHNHYQVVFDLDESIVSYISKAESMKEWVSVFKAQGLYTELSVSHAGHIKLLPHIIHPGLIELLRLLKKEGVEFSFFSYGHHARNEPLVKTIMMKAFSVEIYDQMSLDPLVKSRENMNGHTHKNLMFSLKKGIHFPQIILIDDNIVSRHPEQEHHFMQIPYADYCVFKRVYTGEATVEDLQAANHVFYMTGLLYNSIIMAEKRNIPLSQALCDLQKNPDPIATEPFLYKKLSEYQTYYEKGLDRLKILNPSLELVKRKIIFSNTYALDLVVEHTNEKAGMCIKHF